ncbi:MAG: alpha/beta hydrolase [Saccharofermentanales bacterium]
MENKKFMLWNDDEMVTRSGSGAGTFLSCKPSITFYSAGNTNPAGCVIVCPGGGYGSKTSDYEGEDVARMLNTHGIDAFVLDYRIAPDIHPAPLNDAFRAITMARDLAAELGYLSDKVGILGFSAGGHLAACAGTMWTSGKSRPDAMVLCYPVISMGKFTHIGTRSNLLGNTVNSASISDMSCENRVDRHASPAFIWHTADDEAVPVENSLMMASALSTKAIPFELHIYPKGRHGLGLAVEDPIVSTWTGHCIAWLKSQGFCE